MKRKILSLILALSVLMSCVAMTASADTGLTLLNRKPYSIDTTSSQWAYVTKGGATTLSDGLGGLPADNYGRYYQMNAGEENRIQVKSNANYFTSDYFVLTFNIYSNPTIKFRFSASKYDKDFTSSVLKANQWNNITLIYDKNKATYTRNGQFFVNGVDFGAYIGNGPDVSAGVAINMYMQDTASTYYIDDLAVYSATTAPTVTMPTVTSGTKYTVADSVITYTQGEQLTVADITSTGTAVRAYASTDTAMKTALAEDTVLSAGDVVVVEAPVNDAAEYICRYNYYTVAEGEIVEPEPDPEPEQIGDSSTYWIYDEATTTLTFSGTGALPDWTANSTEGVKDADHHNYRPWYDIRQNVTKVVIGEGITEVGSYTCAQFKSLKTVEFPSTLTTLGSSSFMYTGLEDVVLNDGLTTIESHAFMHQNSETTIYTPLNSITIPSSVTTIAEDAFDFQRATVAIKCYSGSAARTFARNNSFRYILLDKDYELSYASTTGVASYRSFTGVDKDVVAVIFNRKSGVIYDIHFEAITLKGDGTVADVTVPEDFSEEAGTATLIMLWNSWDDITPLCDYISKTH